MPLLGSIRIPRPSWEGTTALAMFSKALIRTQDARSLICVMASTQIEMSVPGGRRRYHTAGLPSPVEAWPWTLREHGSNDKEVAAVSWDAFTW